MASSASWTHPWPPVFDENSRVLVLGSFPSPASRASGFYYGHPQNAFWATLAQVLGTSQPDATPDARRAYLLAHNIACWDVLHACTIVGASDASIRDPEPNLFRPILDASCIETIFANGRTATDLFNRLCASEAGCTATYLPSTSPANRARQALPSFIVAWGEFARVATGYSVIDSRDA